MEPFERGYGHTLGNALRRILLSSMPGYAPTEVTIEGVLHEYSTPGRCAGRRGRSALNLKGVVPKMHNRSETHLRLSKEGEGLVKAGDIEATHDVEILNPEHVIAHLAPGGKIDMQIKVEQGRGYVPSTARPSAGDTKQIGHIVLDASFSPIPPRQLRRRERPGGTAHRPGPPGHGRGDQRRASIRKRPCALPPAFLVDQLSVFADLEGTAPAIEAPKPSQIDPILLRPVG